MLFGELVVYFERIEATSLRNEKTQILAEIIKKASVSEVDLIVYLALGELRPAFERNEFNLADKMILRALGKTQDDYKKIGDLGEIAYLENKKDNRESETSITVSQVYEKLTKIALESGAGSQERKIFGLSQLLKEVGGRGGKFLVRMVRGKLRLGFSDKTILDALSFTEKGTKEYSEELERVYQVRPDVGFLAKKVKEIGVVDALKNIDIEIGTPVVSALAQRLKTADEMIEKMGAVYVEPKYDGTRVQIHFSRNKKMQENQGLKIVQESMFGEEKPYWVKTFTRNLDENSAQFPELLRIGDQIRAESIILDSEAVGYDPKNNKLVPFQVTITRKRKHGVIEAQNTVPLRFFVFDVLYLDGKNLLKLPLSERRKILTESIASGEVLQVDDYIETNESKVLRDYHAKLISEGLEGALVKQKNGEYMPGRVGFNWVKFKEAEDSQAKLSDTIDCVIVGYYLGKGKRNSFGIGAFLVGIRKEEKIVTIAKIGTGISDLQLVDLQKRLNILKTDQKMNEYEVDKTMEVDVWVKPELIVEVAADEITKSPTHSAGYALRFPRLIKIRDDKGLSDITDIKELSEISYGR